MTDPATVDPTPRWRGIGTWEAYAAGLLAIAVIAVALTVRPGSSASATGSASPGGSALALTTASEQPMELPSVSASTTAEPSAGPSSSPMPTVQATPRPTARPTAVPTQVPTPMPSTGILPCIPEPTGYAVQVPIDLAPGEQQVVDIQGQPTGQKVIMSAHYPDGSTVAIGTKYASAPDAGGWTHAKFTWTIPSSMTPGVAQAIWQIPCEGTRDFDSYNDFIIFGPATPQPTPVISDSPAPSV